MIVLLVLLAVGLVQAAVWIPLLRSWRRRADDFVTGLRAEAAASGERFVLGPEKASYRGGSGPYSAVKGNGTIVLTNRRLVFRKLSGGLVEVPMEKVTGIRRSASFRGSRVGGARHLVVATTDPAEVGFFVNDLNAWERALGSARP